MHGRVLDLVEDRKLMPAVYLIWRYESAEEIVQSAAHLVTCIAGEATRWDLSQNRPRGGLPVRAEREMTLGASARGDSEKSGRDSLKSSLQARSVKGTERETASDRSAGGIFSVGAG